MDFDSRSPVVVLAGGTGGAKLARGMADVAGDDLVVIANTGDDVELYGAYVAPDPDLVSFHLADRIDPRGWGLDGDTFHVMDGLRELGVDVWFNLGDRDLVPGDGPRSRAYNVGRMRAVVKEVARLAGFPQTRPKGQGLGLAFHFSHLGYIAEVADVTVSKNGEVKVNKVTAVCDVGAQIVNLSGAENQVQGSIVDGIGAALHQELILDKGRIVQSNFNNYPMIRMNEAPPKIEVHFHSTNYPTTGLGEPAIPPVAPALCNAIFAATGKRVRQFPISKTDLSWS